MPGLSGGGKGGKAALAPGKLWESKKYVTQAYPITDAHIAGNSRECPRAGGQFAAHFHMNF